jgi:hypothetical protein
MIKMIRLSLLGAPTAAILDAAVRCGWLPQSDPDYLRVEASGKDWRECFTSTGHDAMAIWGNKDDPSAEVSHIESKLTVLSAYLDPLRDDIFDKLMSLPFSRAVIASLYPQWRKLPESITGYIAPTLGDGLSRHGWLCAFRGEGHDRLVSRRWLEFGPWRLHKLTGDLSIVEFHDPSVDWETALEQARLGHRRMGISPEGGYIQPQYVYTQAPRGFFDPASGLLKVIINNRPLTQQELLDACALRIETRPMQPGPVREVAYVFMEEDEARANLHELWLRGLQCRAIREGVEVRLDDSYQPQSDPPAWTRAN